MKAMTIEELHNMINKTAEKADVKLGVCWICRKGKCNKLGGSPFYCDNCIDDMRKKDMHPFVYAKKVFNVNLVPDSEIEKIEEITKKRGGDSK